MICRLDFPLLLQLQLLLSIILAAAELSHQHPHQQQMICHQASPLLLQLQLLLAVIQAAAELALQALLPTKLPVVKVAGTQMRLKPMPALITHRVKSDTHMRQQQMMISHQGFLMLLSRRPQPHNPPQPHVPFHLPDLKGSLQ